MEMNVINKEIHGYRFRILSSLHVCCDTDLKEWQRKMTRQERHKLDQREGRKDVRGQRKVVAWMTHHTPPLKTVYFYFFLFPS